jgi:hypothetical protein
MVSASHLDRHPGLAKLAIHEEAQFPSAKSVLNPKAEPNQPEWTPFHQNQMAESHR